MKHNYLLKKVLLSLASLTLTTSLASAASVAITNNSFETGANLPATDGWNNNNPEGWTAVETGAGGVGIQGLSTNPATGAGQDGDYVVFLQGGSLVQNVTAQLLNNAVSVGDLFSLTVAASSQNGAPTFFFDLRDNADISIGNSLIGGPVESAPNAPGGGEYANISVLGTVDTAATDIFLVISGNGPQNRIDNIRLDATQVPEPSSTALLGLASLGLILRRKR